MIKKYLFITILIVSIFTYIIPIQASTNTASLIINEVMPNPSGLDSYYEWVEILNTSATAVNLSDWTLNTNPLPDHQIEPSEIVILANNKQKLAEKYTTTTTVLETNITLLNSGMTLTLINTVDNETNSFEYPNSTEDISFELLSGNCNKIALSPTSNTIGEINSLCTSQTPSTTPTTETDSQAGSVIISKVMPDPLTGEQEWIEILNISDQSIDVNNWVLMDKAGGTQEIITEALLDANNSLQLPIDKFSLNNDGDTLYLYDLNNNLSDIFYYTNSQKAVEISIGYFNDITTQSSNSDIATSVMTSNTSTLLTTNVTNDQITQNTFNELKIYRVGEYPSVPY